MNSDLHKMHDIKINQAIISQTYFRNTLTPIINEAVGN